MWISEAAQATSLELVIHYPFESVRGYQFMSKESVKIIDAYQQGSNDKRLKVYKNPYNKNSE